MLKIHSLIDKLQRFLFKCKWLNIKVNAEQVEQSLLLCETFHTSPFGLPF